MGEHPIAPVPVWVPRTLLDAIHMDLVEQYGGMHGVADGGLIDSALARPENRLAYVPDSDLFALAATLGFGHGYRDGNKRTAFVAMVVFLGLNGWRLMVPGPEAVVAMVYVATNIWDEDRLADWLRQHCVPQPP